MNKVNVIAEIGINHNGSIEIAKKLIDLAKLAGCDYVKFQKRDPDIAVPEKKKNQKVETPWGKIKYIEYKKKIEFSLIDYAEIDKYCRYKKIKWFASVWDINSATELKKLSNLTKIPSAKLTDKKLCMYVRKNYKKRILSTGMSTQSQINKSFDLLKPHILMHTISTYPSPISELNLNYLKFMQSKFKNIEIGYSGHEYGLSTTFAAIGLGARWVERHITLDRHMWGSDQLSSVEPAGLFQLMSGIRAIEKSLGSAKPRRITESEKIKIKSLRG